jgi:hypothetical protein
MISNFVAPSVPEHIKKGTVLDASRFNMDATDTTVFIIHEHEWNDIRDISLMRTQCGNVAFSEHVNKILNGSDECLAITLTRQLESQKILYRQITLLLDFTRNALETVAQHEVMNWALKCHYIDVKSASNLDALHHHHQSCVFSSSTRPAQQYVQPNRNHLVRVVMHDVDPETGKPIKSMVYHVDAVYTTVLKAWNMLCKFHYYLDRVFQLDSDKECMTSDLNGMGMFSSKDEMERLFLNTINYSAKFLYIFFMAKEAHRITQSESCPHAAM